MSWTCGLSRRLGVGALAAAFATVATLASAQESPNVKLPTELAFAGKWTYRSYVNSADQTVAPNDLLFGMANLVIDERSDGSLTGTIGGNGWQLILTGKVDYSPGGASVKFQGTGTLAGEQWVYDYFGYAAPSWDNGIDQVPSVVGTVIRTAPHGGAPAGFSASFIAVKQP